MDGDRLVVIVLKIEDHDLQQVSCGRRADDQRSGLERDFTDGVPNGVVNVVSDPVLAGAVGDQHRVNLPCLVSTDKIRCLVEASRWRVCPAENPREIPDEASRAVIGRYSAPLVTCGFAILGLPVDAVRGNPLGPGHLRRLLVVINSLKRV